MLHRIFLSNFKISHDTCNVCGDLADCLYLIEYDKQKHKVAALPLLHLVRTLVAADASARWSFQCHDRHEG